MIQLVPALPANKITIDDVPHQLDEASSLLPAGALLLLLVVQSVLVRALNVAERMQDVPELRWWSLVLGAFWPLSDWSATSLADLETKEERGQKRE